MLFPIYVPSFTNVLLFLAASSQVRNSIRRGGDVAVKREHPYNDHDGNVVLQRFQNGQTSGDASKFGSSGDGTSDTNGSGSTGKEAEAKSVRLDLGPPQEEILLQRLISVDRTTEETMLGH